MSEESDDNKQINKFYLHAINVVFAVVVGLSFETTSRLTFSSPVDVIIIKIFSLLLIYYVVFSSWLGHYRSLTHWPYSTGGLGKARFVTSLTILYIYYHALFLLENNSNGLYYYIFPLIFATYLIYDIIKNLEYRDEVIEGQDLGYRLMITLLFLGFFTVASIWFYNIQIMNLSPLIPVDTLNSWKLEFLTVFSILIASYRLIKRRITTTQRFTN
jgi:hypothetical protein